MNNYQKSVALNLLGRTREGINTLIDALGDEFFENHATVEEKYILTGLTPKETYLAVYPKDQYVDNVTAVELKELETSFLQLVFTIKYIDQEHNVWGTLYRTKTINKKNIEQYSNAIQVEKKVVLKQYHLHSI